MPTIPKYGQKGAIVSIRLRNFMTYTDVTLNPGPNLNMILGPNGTGKSAIVCSIIVGLAGEVSLTGRATSPAGLVKKGSDWGSTYIELYNERRGNYVVERKIIITGRSESKVDHKSEWKLDGRVAKKSEIQKLTAKLNIKVDNLCQFLPQDSVSTFVKMNSTELLTSTLIAVGDTQLVEDHTKLIDMTKAIESNKSKLDRIKQDCEQNETNARRLEADVEKLREREELIKLKKICEQKVHYVAYTEARKRFDESKTDLSDMRRILKTAEATSEPYRKSRDEFKKQELHLQQVVNQCARNSESLAQEIANAKNEIEDKSFEVQPKFSEFKSKKEHERQREQTLFLKQQELFSLENRLAEEAFGDYSREISKLQDQVDSIKQSIMKSNGKKQTVDNELRDHILKLEEIKRKREQLLVVRDKKVNIIATRRRDAHKVMEWLSKNHDMFRQKIYFPIMCELDVKDPRDAAIVEHAIQEADLFAFVCQTEEDLKKFTAITRRELHAKVNVILRPEKTLQNFENDSSQTPRFEGMNFKAFLKDLIDAPDAIMRYLYGNYNFHNIPVFNDCAETQLKHLLDNCRKFYVGNKFYNVSRSRYDNQIMTVADTVRNARYLLYSLDKQKLQDLDVDLLRLNNLKKTSEEERIKVTREVDDLQREWEKLAEQLKSLNQKQNERARIEFLIERCKVSIQQYIDNRVDMEAERTILQEAIKRINLEQVTLVQTLAKLYKDFVNLKIKHHLNTVLLVVAKYNYKISSTKYENSIEDTKRLKEEIRDKEKKVVSLERQVTEFMEHAKDRIQGFNEGKLDRSTKNKFNTIELDTVDALNEKIDELKARIDCIYHNRAVLSEFERQNRELQEKRRKMMELQTNIDSMDASRRQVKDNWLPKLNEVIKEIDVHYRDFMRKLRYDGQVKLDFDQMNLDNFSTYGIMIMVKYRDNEQLIPLSSTRQSGGERSVATMIYMLALQTKTTVPFRCVDEINQGMDKDNERKVFELLVQTADESSSQYFLVSPKLLSNLPYSDKMKIHVVFNGRKLDLSWPELGSDGDENSHDDDDEDIDVNPTHRNDDSDNDHSNTRPTKRRRLRASNVKEERLMMSTDHD